MWANLYLPSGGRLKMVVLPMGASLLESWVLVLVIVRCSTPKGGTCTSFVDPDRHSYQGLHETGMLCLLAVLIQILVV